ncbi:unnamed protein product [Closterium sp. NIES-53]
MRQRAVLPSTPAHPTTQRASAPHYPTHQHAPLPNAPARLTAQRASAPRCPTCQRALLPNALAHPFAQRPARPASQRPVPYPVSALPRVDALNAHLPYPARTARACPARTQVPPAAALGAVLLGAAALGAAATRVHCPTLPCPALAPLAPSAATLLLPPVLLLLRSSPVAELVVLELEVLVLAVLVVVGRRRSPRSSFARGLSGGAAPVVGPGVLLLEGCPVSQPGGGGFRSTSTGGVEAPGAIEAASLGAFDSASTDAEPEEALQTFTLDSGASCCFFSDSTTVTPLTVPVLVTLADPSGGPVVAHGATVLPCPAAPSGLLTGLHLPSFAKNLVANSVLQDQWVTVTQHRGELVAICTNSRTGEHLATFTRRPGSGLYTLTTESALIAKSGQTLLWHHRLGHPSLPRLRGMHSRLVVSGLPRSPPPFPRSLTPPCLPCVEGRQRAAPHSLFPLTTAPLQSLHMDV